MTESEQKELIGSTFANNKYKIVEFIASGSFSSVYKIKEVNGSRELVVKLETTDTTNPQLGHEFRIYQILRQQCNHWSIAKTYFFGEFRLYLALVMDMFGPSLAFKFEQFGQRFSVKTATLLAIQMIDIFEYIHSRCIIFRDVKPENLVLGLPQTSGANKLHLIDFGFAKEFKDKNGVHIKYREDVGLTGTARYMSINTHMHREQSRRDDMEAIGHLLIYLLKERLPWMGLNITDPSQQYARIGQIKQSLKPEILCSDLPKEFADYLKTVRSLQFTEEPNYKGLSDMFKKLLTNIGEKLDDNYDWNEKKTKNKMKNTKPITLSNITVKENKN